MSSKVLCHSSRTDTSRSLEAFARTCVSGLFLDPEVPIRAIFTSFSMDHPVDPVTAAPIVRPGAMTSTHSSANLSRKNTFFRGLQTFYGNVTRPFAVPSAAGYTSSLVDATSASASSVTLVNSASRGHQGADTTAILLEKTASSYSTTVPAYSSQQQETLVLPFQFSINLARGVTRRNLPYLRHSWTRIDALSVIAFWITFILAQTGVERGKYHIGLFRALSVLRTARLLTITSGTTVSDTACYTLVRQALTADRLGRLSCARSRLPVHCSLAWRILYCLPLPCSRMFIATQCVANFGLTDLLFAAPIGSSVSSRFRARCAGHASWSRPLASPRPCSTSPPSSSSPNHAEAILIR